MTKIITTTMIAIVTTLSTLASATETDALAISARIQSIHVPYGTILAPRFENPNSEKLVSYTHGADSAIWSGHYLAAEAFRYQVTKSEDALNNARRVLLGIERLSLASGTGVLARLCLPPDGIGVKNVLNEEAHHTARPVAIPGLNGWTWLGNTSRDQYIGVFLGLGVAFDLIDKPNVKAKVKEITIRLLRFLITSGWNVTMPGEMGGRVSFKTNYYHRLGLLQVGKHIAPKEFKADFDKAATPSFFDKITLNLDDLLGKDAHDNYYRFNLGHATYYNLIRLETDQKKKAEWLAIYKNFHALVAGHRNAHFNMIDYSLVGANPSRDKDTGAILEEFLKRPRREIWRDYTNKVEVCGSGSSARACQPLPIFDRVLSDYLWQRSPFQISGGGDNTIESPGIDYILPYWMARAANILN